MVTNTVTVDIPQLPVLYRINYRSTLKKLAHVVPQFHLWSFLSDKFTTISVIHHNLNRHLREIFISHETYKEARQKDEYYSVNEFHHSEMFQVRLVSSELCSIIFDLFHSMHFMTVLKKGNEFKNPTPYSESVSFAKNDPVLSNGLEPHWTFLKMVEDVKWSNSNSFARPGHEYFLLGNDPVLFIEKPDGKFVSLELKYFIEKYILLFEQIKNLLKECSPEAIATGIRD